MISYLKFDFYPSSPYLYLFCFLDSKNLKDDFTGYVMMIVKYLVDSKVLERDLLGIKRVTF